MKLFILFAAVLCSYICCGNDIWYQTEMSLYLVPPFQNVYTTLQSNILGQILLTTDSSSFTANDGILTSFVSNIHCQIEKLLQYLNTSTTASNSIRMKVENKLITLINDIKVKEIEIARLGSQIGDVNAQIQAKQTQISTAEQSVRQAESAVASAENELRQAEKEVQDAQLCAGLIGRRKRFLGSVWNSIQNSIIKPIESAANQAGNAISSVANQAGNAISSAVNEAGNAIGSVINQAGSAIVDNVVKPVCSTINFQQIDNARRKVENKKNELASVRNQLVTLKSDLITIQGELSIFTVQLFNLNSELTQLQNSLIVLPNEQHVIVSIHQKLIDVTAHIRTKFGVSSSIADTMATLIDFESIIQPLNAIYDELQQNQFMLSFNSSKISMNQINQGKMNLQMLINLLNNVPLSVASGNCFN